MQNSFTIGDLADEFGVTLRTLRFYEAKDLLHPRRIGNNRLYSRRDRARLKLVLLGRKVGFSLGEIRDMIEAYDLKDGSTETLKLAISRFGGQVEALRRHKHDVEMAIGELTHTIGVVAGMLRAKEGAFAEPQLEAAE
jgi:DNA-binding transcriptional MerR regulator